MVFGAREEPVRGVPLSEAAEAEVDQSHLRDLRAGLNENVLQLDVPVENVLRLELQGSLHQLLQQETGHLFLQETSNLIDQEVLAGVRTFQDQDELLVQIVEIKQPQSSPLIP